MTRYAACGKQVKRGSEHVADAADETWAQIITDALNGERGLYPYQREALRAMGIDEPKAIIPLRTATLQFGDRFTFEFGGVQYEGVVDPYLPPDTIKMQGADHATRPDQTVWSRTDGHIWQRQQDEYACSCGARWDVSDGDEHPPTR